MTQFSYPVSDIENPGGWTAAPLWEKLDEEPFDDADFVESPKSAAGDSFTIGLSPVIDPEVHTDHIIRVRATVGVAGVFEVEILQGVVVIKNFGNIALTTVFQEHSFTLPEAEAGNITDYTNLRIRITAISTQKNQRQDVSWIRVDVPSVGGEEHSGSGSISGNGSLTGTAEKGGRGSALKSAGGTLLAIGLAGMLGIASIVGGGSIVAIGSVVEGSPGIAVITGGGALIGLGAKSAEGIGTISDGGTITAGEEAPIATATGSQVSREERGLLLIGNPDDITFIGKKEPIFISKK